MTTTRMVRMTKRRRSPLAMLMKKAWLLAVASQQ